MIDIVIRLRNQIADNGNWNGAVMTRWDEIRGQVEKYKGSDLPRLNFEGLMDDFSDLMKEAADEIERLRKEIERLKRLMDMRRNWPND